MKMIHKLLLLFVVPLIIVIISIIYINRWFDESALKLQIEKNANNDLVLHIEHINAFFQEKVNELKLIASSSVVQGGNIPEILRSLELNQRSLAPYIEGLYYNNPQGLVYDIKGNTFSVRDRYYFPQIARGEIVITKVITSRATQKPIVLILVPIFDAQGHRTGAIGGTILVADLLQMIRNIKIGKTGFALLLDEDSRIVSGLPISRPGTQTPNFQSIEIHGSQEGLGLLVHEMHIKPYGVYRLVHENSPYLAYFKSIPTMRWSLAVVYKESELLADIRQMENVNILLSVFALISIGLSIYGVRRILLNPLQALIKVHRQMGQGSTTARAEVRTKDEIGELSRSFNEMANQLNERTMGLEKEIYERRLVEAALRESEEKYRQVVENANETILVAQDGMIRFINAKAEDLFGYSREELISQPFINFIHPEHQEMVLQRHLKRLQGEIFPGAYSIKILDSDGNVKWVKINTVVISWEDRPASLTFLEDITEHKHAEEALLQSEAKYRFLTEKINDIIWTTDLEFRVTYISPSIEKVLGFTPQERMGQRPNQTMTPESYTNALNLLSKELMREQEEGIDQGRTIMLELEYYHKNGSIVWMESIVSAIRDERGDLVGIHGVSRDITERKRAEKEKMQLETQLSQAQKMESIGTLAGGIAHDFNNILSAIIGFSELALTDVTDPIKIRREITEVLKAGDRAKDLVRQILTFSRKTDATYSPIILNTIITDSIKMMRSVLPSTIEIRQSLINKGLVLADPTQIHQVMMNLCTNAAHAMDKSGGVLEVRLEKVTVDGDVHGQKLNLLPGPYLRLLVSDTGHGMTPDVMTRIFDPYFTTKEIGKGTGLGLAVVHGIIHGHGGAITCKSSPGTGTTFEIFLPEVLYEEEGGKHLEEKPVPKGTERILFVDDEPALVTLVERILSKLGYSIITKTDSLEALDLFKGDPSLFDLVITDMTMPGMTGDRLAQNLMEIRKDIPIILCTGYSEYISEERAKKTGIRAFIMKPFEMRVLAETIRKVLDRG